MKTAVFIVCLLWMSVANAFHHGGLIMEMEARRVCHMGVRSPKGRMCDFYKSHPLSSDVYPELAPECLTVTWKTANESTKTNVWGNCVNMTTDKEFRYISSNQVPDYYYNPYCPFGLKKGYCIPNEPCPFPDLICGVSQSPGFTEYGDVWIPIKAHYKIPLVGNPTLPDRPADMYAVAIGGAKTEGPATGVHLNGVSIQGPNDAGDVNVDEAGFQLMCGGHVTPPVSGPLYHYHKAPDCSPAFSRAAIPVSHGGDSSRHGGLFGYALDGFGIYSYEDIGGASPVLDECGGHFGPVDDRYPDQVEYHYHATTYTPYHLACQGPALGKCESVQHGANFCGKGCGADVCVQPGTNKTSLTSYLAKFDDTWISKHTLNDF